jgi:putative nucleotidyltransferase with HDIG domain
MDGSPFQFDRGTGSAVASKAILSARTAVRDRLFAGGAAPAPTILLDVLAESLIDRCAQAAAEGSTEALIAWAAATCRSRADVPAVQHLFLDIGPALMHVLADESFAALTARMTPVIEANRPAAADAGADMVDELDLLLAGMLSLVESNDPMTAEHCRAVSAWCGRIAYRMSLTRAEALFVARGGLIHDVGKSKTPAEILLAPRKLSDSEWTIMREHVTEGHDIVRDNAHLREFGGIVRSHHERVDGRGYPDGLERGDIPIAVRIVTVADAFNAMIGRRSYRTPLSPDVATSELQRHAGTQFDSNVVEALIDVLGGGHNRQSLDGVVAC